MKILVVCGAGASSTFVALRIRTAAKARGIAVTASAGQESMLGDGLQDVDVVLVGSHLGGRLHAITEQAGRHDAAVALLPEDVFGENGGDRALDLALGARTASA
ncbi:PTS sugar transporter subunit IIB [Plantibacter sp. YIM 135249]|jgi:PTS system cellobiose-specific IIB component|uniref:PTS sugar transporter subunit IIB n=1 Tax=Plantibacter sp. YIM 135249 TaxID=3423918 RepID=UPI003D34025B